ncbi:YjgP/YjgQ family permease [Oceanotoga teriensis]|uniref:YjgP/YjgQ family permease n=1 Tax=Oceanotoga teriensis TaxID=515440 RepID=UPI002712A608|nr:YjgP/YjgQ family permease [Oceanotoga teriensis]MDO7975397.1 LptF/LptG family permease [Oceanotoga teriensis]
MIRLIKYISREFFSPFLMGLFGFVIFVSVQLLYELSEIIVRNKVGFDKLLLLIWYNLPYFVSMGIPVGVLFGIFWLMSRLSNDNEIIAIQTLGIPAKRLMIPFLIISILLSFFTFMLFDSIVPKSNYEAKQAMAKYIYQKPEAVISDNEFVDLGDNRYLFVKELDRENGTLYDILLYEVDYKKTTVFHAQKAKKYPDGWKMENGRSFRVDSNGFLEFDLSFKSLSLDLEKDVEEFLNFGKSANEMTSKELKEKIDTFSKLGSDVSGLIVSFQSKFANALAPLVISILGVSLSLFLNLKSKSWSVITTFLLVVLYQGSGAWLNALGKEKIINPVLSAWIPDILFGIVGILLFFLLDTEISFKITEPLKKIFVVLIALLIFPSISYSANVNIESNDFQIIDDILQFNQELKILYKDSIITAEKGSAVLNDDNTINSAELTGNVIYTHGESTIEASTMTINFEKDDSFFINSYTLQKYKDDKNEVEVKVWSEEIYKPLEDDYFISEKTKMTTCKDCITYYFKSRKVTIYPEKFLIARDVTLEFFGVPVLYLPFYFQSLNEDDNEPFSLKFDYENNKLTFLIGINYLFENESLLKLKYGMTNDFENSLTYQKFLFKYGIKVFDKYLYLYSNIENNINTELGFEYDIYDKDSYMRLTQDNKNTLMKFDLYIPELKTPYGNIKNIRSNVYWNENTLYYIKFLQAYTDAYQKKYKKSIISLSRLGVNLEYKNLNGFNIVEAWKEKNSRIEVKGKYGFYSKYSNLTGDLYYNLTSESSKVLNNQIDSKNKFEYDYTLNKFKLLDIDGKTGFETTSNFNHKRDFTENSKYSIGHTLFDFTLKPKIDMSWNILEFGNFVEFKKVFENSLTPSATDEVNYGDYIGYKLSFFENNFKNAARITRKYNFLKDGFDKISYLELKTDTSLNIINFKNQLQTKTLFDTDIEIKPKTTEVKFKSELKPFYHTSEFTYKHNEEKPIEYILNKEKVLFNRNRLEIEYKIYPYEEEIEKILPELLSSYSFYIFGNKLIGKFNIKDDYNRFELYKNKFLEENSLFSMTFGGNYYRKENFLTASIGIESRDEKEFADMEFEYDIENEILDFKKFEIQKRIICWTFNIKADISFLPQFELKKFTLTFFINNLPNKNVAFSDDGFEFGLM